SGSLELVWSVRRGLVGQWGVRGEEVFIVGRHLAVYSLSDGRELRRVRLPKDYGRTTFGEISPELAITDTSLVFAWYDFRDKEAKIFSYDPKTLALRWERAFPWAWDVRSTRPTFSVVVSGDHLYALAIGKEGQNLFKLRLSDGRTVWSVAIEKYVQGVPLVLHDGKLLVRSIVSISHPDKYGYLQAFNPLTGENLWRVRIDGESTFDDPPLIFTDRTYVTSQAVLSDPDHFYTIELTRGMVVRHQRVRLLRAPFAEYQGILYFGGNTPAAFHIGREEIVWQADLRGPQGLGTPVSALGVLDTIREEIYLGDWERDLYVLSARTGEVKDKVYIRGYWRGEFFSPLKAFFGSYGVKRLALVRGFLFVGTVDSSLFVFRRMDKE
ncbi:MAG: PQQ-binding-like beta-propeller repeat protein, partial [Candidatus Methylomirabilales bacterium]